MQNPTVSVIIPVYNGSDYMAQAIDSALAQTYKNTEVIVVNDGSTDGGKTEEIALSYGDKIKYIKKENGGVSSALNVGIKNMSGEFFSWLSHDDVYYDTKIEDQIKIIEKLNDKKVLVYCQSELIDKDSNPIKTIKKDFGFRENALYSWDEVLMNLLNRGVLNGCGLLIPREIFDICGLFDESLRYNQDVLMWYKIFMEKYSLYYDTAFGTKLRIHDKQLTQTGRELFHKDSEKASLYLIPEFAKISSREKNFLFAYAKDSAKYGNFKIAKNCIEKGKETGLFKFSEILKIRQVCLYGRIRPLIRRVYYRLFRKIKTK